jgi:hypothetical protein
MKRNYYKVSKISVKKKKKNKNRNNQDMRLDKLRKNILKGFGMQNKVKS